MPATIIRQLLDIYRTERRAEGCTQVKERREKVQAGPEVRNERQKRLRGKDDEGKRGLKTKLNR